MSEEFVETRLKLRRDGGVQSTGFHIRGGPRHTDDTGQQPLKEGMTTEDGIGGALARGGELPESGMSVAWRNQSVIGESAEHLCGRLLAHLKVFGNERRSDPLIVTVAAEGEEILLGRRCECRSPCGCHSPDPTCDDRARRQRRGARRRPHLQPGGVGHS